MTRKLLAAACALWALGFASAAAADDTAIGDRQSHRAAVLEEFDGDGDGRLSRDEREAAHAARRDRRRQGGLDRFDTNGDGRLTGDERSAAREARAARRAENGGEGMGRRHGRGGNSRRDGHAGGGRAGRRGSGRR